MEQVETSNRTRLKTYDSYRLPCTVGLRGPVEEIEILRDVEAVEISLPLLQRKNMKEAREIKCFSYKNPQIENKATNNKR